MRKLLQKLIRTIGYDVHKVMPSAPSPNAQIDQRIERYLNNGRVPWSEGYIEYRRRFLSELLQDERLVSIIATGGEIPCGFGKSLCERCVEYPWCLHRIRSSYRDVLDAGSTLNHDFILSLQPFVDKNVTITTLAPEPECYWNRGISYVFGDLRNLVFKDETFDLVVCLSTLEHVGMDNSIFDAEGVVIPDRECHLEAVSELRRVLRPEGRLLLTVPYGLDPLIPETMVFTARMIENVIATFRPRQCHETYYKYSASGWHSATAKECAEAEYEPWVMLAAHKRPTEIPASLDGAAAARAVCCLEMTK